MFMATDRVQASAVFIVVLVRNISVVWLPTVVLAVISLQRWVAFAKASLHQSLPILLMFVNHPFPLIQGYHYNTSPRDDQLTEATQELPKYSSVCSRFLQIFCVGPFIRAWDRFRRTMISTDR